MLRSSDKPSLHTPVDNFPTPPYKNDRSIFL